MKLKRFTQFIGESRVSDRTATIHTVVEENMFLIDDQIYIIMIINLEVSVKLIEADPDVGYTGGLEIDSWSIDSIESVTKITEPDIAKKCQDLISNSTELSSMGIGEVNPYHTIENLILNADSEEVSGQELKALQSRVFELDIKNELIDLTGSFKDRCNKSIDTELESWDPYD